MTPDTTALRRDHYDYDSDRHCDDCGEPYPCTVRALCNGYDEAQRLRAKLEQLRCDHCGRLDCDWEAEIQKARAETAEAREREARGVASELIDKLGFEHVRANEAARLSSEAVGKAEDAERRWADHQDVCVMASLDREQLETRLAALLADLRALCDHASEGWVLEADDLEALLDRHAPVDPP